MPDNKLSQVSLSEGIYQKQLADASDLSVATVGKAWRNDEVPTDLTKSRTVKAINEISGKDYRLEDVYPSADPVDETDE